MRYKLWPNLNEETCTACTVQVNLYTGGHMKCPKKYVKEKFIMWWHMHFFRNAPKSKMFIFGSFSVFRIKWEKFNWSRAFFSKCPTFLCSFFLKCPIFPIWFWKQKMNRKWTSSILGHFEKKCIFHHMINSSFTYFLGHFMLPPV